MRTFILAILPFILIPNYASILAQSAQNELIHLPFQENEELRSISGRNDTLYLLGTATRPNSKIAILKAIDTNGKVYWEWRSPEQLLTSLALHQPICLDQGGFLIAGNSRFEQNEWKSENNKGENDIWLLRLDQNRKKVWDLSLGGYSNDLVSAVVELKDGGFLVGGFSSSGKEDTKQSSNYGMFDYWVIRISPNGKVLWDRNYGGKKWDQLFDIIPTREGNFVLLGTSDSGMNHDKTAESFGSKDGWVICIDPQGNPLWDRAFGGIGNDILQDGIEARNGDLLCIGQFNEDIWSLRTNAKGEVQKARINSADAKDMGLSIHELPDASVLLAGYSESNPGKIKTAPHLGKGDGWLITLDPKGKPASDKVIGGKSYDIIFDLFQDPKGIVWMAGSTTSGQGAEQDGPLHFFIQSVNNCPEIMLQVNTTRATENENDGSIVITAREDLDDTAFQWSGPDGFSSIGKSILGLNPGVYNLTIHTQNGCDLYKVFSIEGVLKAEDKPQLSKGWPLLIILATAIGMIIFMFYRRSRINRASDNMTS